MLSCWPSERDKISTSTASIGPLNGESRESKSSKPDMHVSVGNMGAGASCCFRGVFWNPRVSTSCHYRLPPSRSAGKRNARGSKAKASPALLALFPATARAASGEPYDCRCPQGGWALDLSFPFRFRASTIRSRAVPVPLARAIGLRRNNPAPSGLGGLAVDTAFLVPFSGCPPSTPLYD